MNPLQLPGKLSRTLSTRKRLSAVAVLGLVPALAAPQAAAGAPADELASSTHHSTYQIQLLAKAAPDECFAGIGVDYPPGPPCAVGKPKVNQAYVWSLAKAGHDLWFGTGANVLCLKPPGYKPGEPSVSPDLTCEYGNSQPAREDPTLPPELGDYRPPEVLVYDLSTRRLTDKTAEITGASEADAHLLRTTAGLRAGGTLHGVVILSGPGLAGGVNLFAFDTHTGHYLGSTSLTAYENIRHFVVAEDALYLGLGVGVNGGEGGRVLRWTGDRSHPFSFVEVGAIATQVADLTVHQGRIFVSTWPATVFETGSGAAAGARAAADAAAAPAANPAAFASVYMSPPLKNGAPGLNPEDATGWTQVWNASQYEPDVIVGRAYALGGLASYGGTLYWGTMHVPLQATGAFLAIHPPKTQEEAAAAVENTQRAASIFQGRDFGTDHQRVDLLYGAAELPAFDPTANGGAGAWSSVATGYTPRFGAAGFGDSFNLYAWKMAVAGGKLFVGTMDMSYIALGNQEPESLQQLATDLGLSADVRAALGNAAQFQAAAEPAFGGDLWAFSSATGPAEAVSTTGLGNYLNQGVRNLVADGSTLYIGTANPENLATDLTDDKPEGGWELLKLTVR